MNAITSFGRDIYNAVMAPPQFVRDLLVDAERAGCWETGIVSDRKQRGSAVNTAVYGFDEAEGLAVVQVRESVFHPRRYTRVRKDYYLIGRVEDGSVFTHPVDPPTRSKLAMSDPKLCVDWCLSRIWNCPMDELKDIIRQGDVAFIPVRDVPADAVEVDNGEAVVIRDTHRLTGRIWKRGDEIYAARGATLKHTKGEHKAVKAKGGFWRVVPGYRAAVWGFTRPTAD